MFIFYSLVLKFRKKIVYKHINFEVLISNWHIYMYVVTGGVGVKTIANIDKPKYNK